MEQAGALEQSVEVIILRPGCREARPCAVVDDLRRAQPGADAEEVKPHAPRMKRDGGAVDACAAHRRHRTATQCVRRNRADHRAVVTKMRESDRSEEHTSELQSLMRISYAVFCLKKKKNTI